MFQPRRFVFWFTAVIAGVVIAVAGFVFLFAWQFENALVAPPCPEDAIPLRETFEELWLVSGDGTTIRAWYYPGVIGAAIITLGGMEGSLGRKLPEGGFLLDAGYALLQLDSRACSHPSALVTLGLRETADALAAYEYLQSRPEVDEGRIGVFGFSMGGVAAIRFAARSSVTAVVAEGGYHNLGADFVEPDSREPWLQELLQYTIALLFWFKTNESPWNISPIDDLPYVSPRPVFLIYGENEARSGRAEEQYAAALSPKELWIVPGGSHGINQLVASEEYQTRILDFFDQHLGVIR